MPRRIGRGCRSREASRTCRPAVWRGRSPAGASGHRDVAFLNHGSFGACPKPVFDAYQNWQGELEAQPVDFLGRRINGLLAEARSNLGGFVGTDADNLVFVPNATYAVNIVARSLDLAP